MSYVQSNDICPVDFYVDALTYDLQEVVSTSFPG
jgi:hypothetical protein